MVRAMSGPIRLMVFQGYRPGYGSFGALTRPLLRFGDRGSAVKEAQNALMNVLQRSFRYGADGVFGPETFQAVKDAQTQFGLRVSGEIDSDTWTLLLGQEVNATPPLPSRNATTMDPVRPNIPGTSGPGTGQPRNDGEFVVGGPFGEKKSNTMMIVGGVAVAGVLAYLLLGKGK